MPIPPPSERQAKLIWLAVCAGAIALLIGLLCLAVWGLGQVLHVMAPVLWPLAVAGVLAYLLDPVVDFFERRHVPRTRAIVCVFAVALAVFLGVLGSVVPQAVNETRQLLREIPNYSQRVRASVETWVTQPGGRMRGWLAKLPFGQEASGATNAAVAPVPGTEIAAPPVNGGGTNGVAGAAGGGAAPTSWIDQLLAGGTLQSAADWLAKVLPGVGQWLFGQVLKVASWFSVFAGLALVPVYLFYFLLQKQAISSRWTDYLPVANSAFKEELVFVLRSVNGYLIAFFRGQVLVAICDGVMYTLGFLLIGLPYAVLIGLVATVLTIVPFLGAIVTCVSALLVALVQYGDLKHPLLVLAVFVVVQTIEGFVVQPKIVGDKVGLHPLTIIVALMVGTTLLGGILGGLLAIPFTAALRVLMFRYVWRTADECRPGAAAGG